MRHGFVDSGAGQLHYVEAGKGPPLLLIPHAGRSSRMYRDLIGELSSDFRVVSIDVPGTGASAPLPAGEHGIAEIADWLVEGLDALGLQSLDIFGLHGGNKLGGSIAGRHPSRVHKFVYAGQSHSIIPDKARRDEIFRKTPSIRSIIERADRPLPFWAGQFREMADIWWDEATLADLDDPAARRVAVERVLDGLQAFMDRPQFYRAAFAYDMKGDLALIRAPTLILELTTPKEDREVGRQGDALLGIIPNATLETLESPDVYAVTLEDRAAEVAGILRRFLLGE